MSWGGTIIAGPTAQVPRMLGHARKRSPIHFHVAGDVATPTIRAWMMLAPRAKRRSRWRLRRPVTRLWHRWLVDQASAFDFHAGLLEPTTSAPFSFCTTLAGRCVRGLRLIILAPTTCANAVAAQLLRAVQRAIDTLQRGLEGVGGVQHGRAQ